MSEENETKAKKDDKCSIVIKLTPSQHEALSIAKIKQRKASVSDLVMGILETAAPEIFA
jgi:hypothetical protein